jgi:hypothetical protein
MDLSATSYPNLYDATSWKDYTSDGHIYLLPGPISSRFIAYNRSLFEEKGWTVPQSLDDIVTLCSVIRSSGEDITPLSFPGANLSACESLFEGLIQNDCSFRKDGYSWLSGYESGTSSCAEGVKNASAMLKKLMDAKAFSVTDGNRWRGEAYDRFVNQRQSALLYVYNGQSDLDQMISKSKDSFGAIALPGYHKNNYLLGIESVASFGLSKRLEEKGQEKKKAKALEVIAYLSGEEGMAALAGESNPLAYPLRGVSNQGLSPFFQSVFSLSDTSIQARSLAPVFHDISSSLSSRVQKVLFQYGSLTGLTEDIDSWHQSALQGQSTEFHGEFAEDFTSEETAQFCADVIQSKGYGDLSLVTEGEKRNGIVNEMGSSWGKIYAGTVKADYVSIPVPKDGGIITAQVPGKLLIPLLNKGRKIVSADKKIAYFPLYFSGMQAVMEKGKIVSLRKDGAEIDESKTYTLSYVEAGTLTASLKEVQSELSLSQDKIAETDTHIQILTAYSGYLENRKGTPIPAPAVSVVSV